MKKVTGKLLREHKERVEQYAREQAEEKALELAGSAGGMLNSRGTSICSTKRESMFHA